MDKPDQLTQDLAMIARNAIDYIRGLERELERCKQVCAATAEAWRMNALEPDPVQEPVAWMDREGDLYKMPEMEGWAPPHTMLYAKPPQRKPLTRDETMQLANETAGQHWCDEAHLQRLARAIERAHGIGGTNESA